MYIHYMEIRKACNTLIFSISTGANRISERSTVLHHITPVAESQRNQSEKVILGQERIA